MKKYIFFTNIPAPYRIAFYNELYERGFDFEVYYMRTTHDERQWKFDERDMRHPHYINNGYYRMLGRFHLYFNPRLVAKIWRARGAEVIIGANWNDPDVLLLVFLKRLRLLSARFHWWSEANYLTIGASKDNALKRAMRQFVYNSSEGVQISSGRMTEITLEKWGLKEPRFVPLPNTIEERKFTISDTEVEERERNELPVFLMPVRLLENVKGMVSFLRSIGDENVRKGLFLIAGEGPDRPLLESFIHSRGLERNVQVLGFCDTPAMVALYKKANVFVLPSFSDPSPLSVVEALRMRLPMLVSERCGNHFEGVMNGRNGYVFDPMTPASVRSAFESLLSRRNEWPAMGKLSEERYSEVFDMRIVADNFVRSLEAATA